MWMRSCHVSRICVRSYKYSNLAEVDRSIQLGILFLRLVRIPTSLHEHDTRPDTRPLLDLLGEEEVTTRSAHRLLSFPLSRSNNKIGLPVRLNLLQMLHA